MVSLYTSTPWHAPYMMYPCMMYPNMFPPQQGAPNHVPGVPPVPAAAPHVNGTAGVEQPPPPVNNITNFPPPDTNPSRPLPNINVNAMYDTFSSMEAGTGQVNTDTALKDMYGMMLHLFSKSAENDAMKSTVGK